MPNPEDKGCPLSYMSANHAADMAAQTCHHKIPSISKTTGPNLTIFSHNVSNIQGQILWAGQLSIPSLGWENPHFLSNSRSVPTADLVPNLSTHLVKYLRNLWADFTQIFTQCEQHPGADSVSSTTLNSFCGLRKSTFSVRIGVSADLDLCPKIWPQISQLTDILSQSCWYPNNQHWKIFNFTTSHLNPSKLRSPKLRNSD